MANFDDFKLAVEAATGGKNTVILDDLGMPSVMVLLPRMKNKEIMAGGSDAIHPGFRVNTAEVDMYISKFHNIVMNDRGYSLALKSPKTSVNHDQAVSYSRNKGDGWGLMPFSTWAAIALWCRKNGTMPRGNNNYGADHAYSHEKGISDGSRESDGKWQRVLTGSGPDTWSHNWMPDGIYDLNGNVWDWTAGLRLNNGEIQVIPYADCMDHTVSLAAGSTAWRAIAADGSYVAPGSTGALKYDVVGGKIQLTNGSITPKDAGNWLPYNNMTLGNGLVAPEMAKALILYPDEPGADYGGDYHGVNTSGERVAICGGSWGSAGAAGVFDVNLGNLRSDADGNIGFRSAYYRKQ